MESMVGRTVEADGQTFQVIDQDENGLWCRVLGESGITLVRDGAVVRWTPAPEGPASSYTRAA